MSLPGPPAGSGAKILPSVAGFFAGLELVEPGVVSCSRWRPDGEDLP